MQGCPPNASTRLLVSIARLTGAGIALFGCATACAQTIEDWTVLRELAASVVRVQSMVSGKTSTASGVALTSDLAVTNCHVVGDSLDARVMRGSLSAAATLKLRDVNRDICILNV